MVQFCFSQKVQNMFHFDVREHIGQTIHLEKFLSDESGSSTFYKNVFNSARHLTCQTLCWLFLFQYERVNKPCMTTVPSRYYDLFSSWFPESWLFSDCFHNLSYWIEKKQQQQNILNLKIKLCFVFFTPKLKNSLTDMSYIYYNQINSRCGKCLFRFVQS